MFNADLFTEWTATLNKSFVCLRFTISKQFQSVKSLIDCEFVITHYFTRIVQSARARAYQSASVSHRKNAVLSVKALDIRTISEHQRQTSKYEATNLTLRLLFARK